MVHKGEGGQICPKIGPHGLRMPSSPNLYELRIFFNISHILSFLSGKIKTKKTILYKSCAKDEKILYNGLNQFFD